MEKKTCCFSGHRPKAFPWRYNEKDPQCVWLKGRIAKEIERAVCDGFTRFIVGGAMGVDMWSAEAVIEYKKKHKRDDIELVLAIPFLDYAVHFTEDDKNRLMKIIDASSERVLTSPEDDTSRVTLKYYKRNEYMVDNSQRLIAVYEPRAGMRGGTKYTVEYAEKKGAEVVVIPWRTEYEAEMREKHNKKV
ncbi:MAG: DUF1273 family protein [Clostridia bacterium]|nr:DUF1273 family protein [Clostridia bacterium]